MIYYVVAGSDLYQQRVRLQLEDRVTDWLATIPIGGRESRHYDQEDLVRVHLLLQDHCFE